MSDLSLYWPSDTTGQGDFGIGPDGDILIVDGDAEATQRCVRRVLTNSRTVSADGSVLPCDYIFDTTYGVGLRRMIGMAVNSKGIEKVKQMTLDGIMSEVDFVAQNPPPQVSCQGYLGGLQVAAAWTSAISNRPVATPRINLS